MKGFINRCSPVRSFEVIRKDFSKPLSPAKHKKYSKVKWHRSCLYNAVPFWETLGPGIHADASLTRTTGPNTVADRAQRLHSNSSPSPGSDSSLKTERISFQIAALRRGAYWMWQASETRLCVSWTAELTAPPHFLADELSSLYSLWLQTLASGNKKNNG